jgi:hypothetical protein
VSSAACEDNHARCRILGDHPADVWESALFKFPSEATRPRHTSLDFNWKLRRSNSYRNNILDRCIFNIYTVFPFFKTSAHPKGASGLQLPPTRNLKKKNNNFVGMTMSMILRDIPFRQIIHRNQMMTSKFEFKKK